MFKIFKKAKANDESEILQVNLKDVGQFEILPNAPESHKYYSIKSEGLPLKIVQAENKILKNCLPPNIWVKTFQDKINLFSIMIAGPEDTPYANGLFVFDAILPTSYPNQPPLFHFYSYSKHKINPNLYTSGIVCLSLLGTWSGSGCECWKKTSTLLQVIVSIQGLILVKEPYYNEPGFQFNSIASNNYNKSTILSVIEYMNVLRKSNFIFEKEIKMYADERKRAITNTTNSRISCLKLENRKRKIAGANN